MKDYVIAGTAAFTGTLLAVFMLYLFTRGCGKGCAAPASEDTWTGENVIKFRRAEAFQRMTFDVDKGWTCVATYNSDGESFECTLR